MKNILIILCALLPTLSLAQSGSKNAVFLKDGSLKEGYITEIIPGEYVKMELESGEILVVQMTDIEKITGVGGEKTFKYTQKGRFVISGEIDFSSAIYKEEYPNGNDHVKKINFRPQLGYFVADDFLVSMAMELGYSKTDNYRLFSVMGGPSVQYFLGGEEDKWRPFFQGDLMIGWVFQKIELQYYNYGNYFQDVDGRYRKRTVLQYGWGLGGGISYFPSETISLDLGVEYVFTASSLRHEDVDDIKTKGVALVGGISFYLQDLFGF
jgi:hypothetical protein